MTQVKLGTGDKAVWNNRFRLNTVRPLDKGETVKVFKKKNDEFTKAEITAMGGDSWLSQAVESGDVVIQKKESS